MTFLQSSSWIVWNNMMMADHTNNNVDVVTDGASPRSPSTYSKPNHPHFDRSFAELAAMLQSALDNSSTVFHVSYMDPVGLNLAVFELWIRGFREEQVVYYRRNLLGKEMDEASERQLLLLLYRDAIDQYRLMDMIQEFLEQPFLMRSQLHAQISPRIQEYMINKFYEFDDEVFRELLGRKLTTRARKELDEVAESTGILLRCCQRQFDNLRRIYTALDERNFEGNITAMIEEQYMIPWTLAERYTCILFLLYNRFHLQSNKKRTSFLSMEDLEYCAAMILLFWASETSYSFSGGLNNMNGAPASSSTSTLVVPSTSTLSTSTGNITALLGTQPKNFTGAQYFTSEFETFEPVKKKQSSDTIDQGNSQNGSQQNEDDEEENDDHHHDDNEDEYQVDHDLENQQDDGDTEDEKGGDNNKQQQPQQQQQQQQSVTVASSSPPIAPPQSLQGSSSNILLERRRTASVNKPLTGNVTRPGNTSMEISPNLIWKWRMIKNHVLGTGSLFETTCKTILQKVNAKVPTGQRLKSRFYKNWVKALLTIGSGLAQAKELRDFFEDVVVLLCEPLQGTVDEQALVTLLDETALGFEKLDFVVKKEFVEEWKIYMQVMSRIISRVYKAIVGQQQQQQQQQLQQQIM